MKYLKGFGAVSGMLLAGAVAAQDPVRDTMAAQERQMMEQQKNMLDQQRAMMERRRADVYRMFDMITGAPIAPPGAPAPPEVEEADDETGPSSTVAFTLATRAMLKAADLQKGRQLAKKAKCRKCHSDNGIAEDPDDPNIAGQMRSYAYKQMMDYKNGHRDARSMTKALKKLSEEDIVHLAAWFESIPPAPSMKKDTGLAANLVYRGDPKRMLKPCASCHGRNGEGGQHDSATLTGQSYGYFIQTMTDFKEGDRGNDIYSRMRLIAEVLTEDEISALADYYAAEPPGDE